MKNRLNMIGSFFLLAMMANVSYGHVSIEHLQNNMESGLLHTLLAPVHVIYLMMAIILVFGLLNRETFLSIKRFLKMFTGTR